MRALLWLVLAASPSALAGGFSVSDQDAAASGRSGTGVGVSGTASSLHFNPAGLGAVDGVSAVVGASVLMPSATASALPDGTSSSSVPGLRVPPHLYAAWGTGRFTVAAGFNAPFGGGLTWPGGWAGRTELTELQLQVLSGHLGGAFRINEQLSVGANVTLASASVYLDRVVDFVSSEGRARLGGSGLGVGGQAGVTYAPNETVRLGLMGRLPVGLTLSGRAHFDGVPPSFASTLPDQAITAPLTLPAKLAFGADVKTPWARVLLDVEYTFWSSFKSFDINFADAATPDVSQPRNWADAPTFRLGAERVFGKTTARAGVIVDFAASPADTLSPSLPDAMRLGVSVGVGRDFGPVRADAAYQFVSFLPRTATGEAFPAAYSANAHVLAVTLSTSLGGSAKGGAGHEASEVLAR